MRPSKGKRNPNASKKDTTHCVVCSLPTPTSRTTVEQISNEVNAIDNRIKKIKKQIELPKTEEDIKFQMEEFLSVSARVKASVKVALGRTKESHFVLALVCRQRSRT